MNKRTPFLALVFCLFIANSSELFAGSLVWVREGADTTPRFESNGKQYGLLIAEDGSIYYSDSEGFKEPPLHIIEEVFDYRKSQLQSGVALSQPRMNLLNNARYRDLFDSNGKENAPKISSRNGVVYEGEGRNEKPIRILADGRLVVEDKVWRSGQLITLQRAPHPKTLERYMGAKGTAAEQSFRNILENPANMQDFAWASAAPASASAVVKSPELKAKEEEKPSSASPSPSSPEAPSKQLRQNDTKTAAPTQNLITNTPPAPQPAVRIAPEKKANHAGKNTSAPSATQAQTPRPTDNGTRAKRVGKGNYPEWLPKELRGDFRGIEEEMPYPPEKDFSSSGLSAEYSTLRNKIDRLLVDIMRAQAIGVSTKITDELMTEILPQLNAMEEYWASHPPKNQIQRARYKLDLKDFEANLSFRYVLLRSDAFKELDKQGKTAESLSKSREEDLIMAAGDQRLAEATTNPRLFMALQARMTEYFAKDAHVAEIVRRKTLKRVGSIARELKLFAPPIATSPDKSEARPGTSRAQ